MIAFKIIYGLDVIVALIILYFFFIGITDGTVSSYNALIWFVLLAALALVLGGSLWLKSHDYIILAYTAALVLAIPAILFVLYFLIAIFGGGRWN